MYINERAPEPRMRKIGKIFEEENHDKIWALKCQLQTEFTLSLIFVLFSVGLSSAATVFANHFGGELNIEIERYYSYTNTTTELKLMHSLVHTLLIQDFLVLFVMVILILRYCFITKDRLFSCFKDRVLQKKKFPHHRYSQ